VEDVPKLVVALHRAYRTGYLDAANSGMVRSAVELERNSCADLMAELRTKSRNHLFRSALTIAEGEIRARGQKEGAC
jgi:hypothetical protein